MDIKTSLDIDNYTAGLWNGDLIVIAGRPGMGTRSLACTLSHHVVLDNEGRVKLLSLRSNERRLKERFVGLATRESRESLMKMAQQENHDFNHAVEQAFKGIYQDELILDSQPGMAIDDLVSNCKADANFELLIVDNLQLLTDDSKTFENRWEEMSSICRKFKSLSLELDIPVILLSHVSREVERRGGDKRPHLNDLSDSGAIEQVADIVMFVYRAEYYGIKTTPEGHSTSGLAEIILPHNDRGICRTIPMLFNDNYGRFENHNGIVEET